MKKLARVLAAVGLVLVCAPAHATFKGTLKADQPVTVQVTSSPGNAGSVAVVAYYLGRSLDVEAVFSVPPNTEVARDCPKLGGRVSRVIVEVDLPAGGTAVLRVSQGAIQFEEALDQGTNRFVFDVVP